MTEKEKVELLLTGVRFTCKDCQRECIGSLIEDSPNYLWCPSCLTARFGKVVAAGSSRFTLPLEDFDD